MIYTFFLGGTNIESGYAIAVDSSHAPYVAGITYSNDFPAFGALQNNFGGVRDGFVAKLNPVGYYLDWATYIGGSAFDAANGIAVDSAGFTYVTGVTASADFPSSGPTQGFPAGGSSMAFITKLKPGGLGAVYSILWGAGPTQVWRSRQMQSATPMWQERPLPLLCLPVRVRFRKPNRLPGPLSAASSRR